VSADQFSTVVDKEKYFCDNDTSNVDTDETSTERWTTRMLGACSDNG